MMKKTLLVMGVALALGTSYSAFAVDSITTGAISTGAKGGAKTEGAASPATNSPSSSYNSDLVNSENANYRDVANDVNSSNVTNIGGPTPGGAAGNQDGDGIVIHAQSASQAVATSDLDSTISGNVICQDSACGAAGAGVLTNSQGKVTRYSKNVISASYSGAAGVNIVSQNIGDMASIQQSTVVQSNFNLQP